LAVSIRIAMLVVEVNESCGWLCKPYRHGEFYDYFAVIMLCELSLFVCPSATLFYSVEMVMCYYHLAASLFQFSHAKHHGKILMASSLMGAVNEQ